MRSPYTVVLDDARVTVTCDQTRLVVVHKRLGVDGRRRVDTALIGDPTDVARFLRHNLGGVNRYAFLATVEAARSTQPLAPTG